MDNVKVKLSDEHEKRLEELYDAANEYLKVITDNPYMEPDREAIGEINDMAADLMFSKGHVISYPSIKLESDGTRRVAEYYERDATAKFNRLVTIILRDADPDYPLGKLSMIGIRTSLSDDEIVPAIMKACDDYLHTPEGKQVYEDNCNNFNFGDFDMNVPNKLCIPHGFMKLSSAPDILDEDFNMQLAWLPDEDEEGEK